MRDSRWFPAALGAYPCHRNDPFRRLYDRRGSTGNTGVAAVSTRGASYGQEYETATSTKTKTRTFTTSIGLPAGVRGEMIDLLNARLADTLDLYSQTKQAHWNVKGPEFYQLHLLFDEHAGHADGWTDLIAERVAILGGYANGTVRMAASNSSLDEFPADITESMEYVEAVAARWATYANAIREAIDEADKAGDATTADLLTEISRQADMDLWFQEAHLQDR